MGWERRGSGTYYYCKERQGGRVVSRYIGRGELAHAIAGLDDLDRRGRENARLQHRQAIEQARRTTAAAEAALRDLDRVTTAAVTAALIEAGYHQHKRQWRKKRDGGTQATDPAAARSSTAS